MTTDAESDVELVRRFQRGDPSAYEALVRRYQNRVYRLAAVWLDDAQHAADVTQEVFLRGLKGFKSFRYRAAPFTWLYRTTKNVCREFNRRRPTETLEIEPGDPSADTENEIKSLQAARRVRELITSLPERQREVVVLRIFEDLSVAETAIAMGCREGTVKALMHKATAGLRLKLRPGEEAR